MNPDTTLDPAMARPPLEAPGWSARRWGSLLVLAFAGQILLIWILGERPAPPPTAAAFATRVDLIDPARLDAQWDPWLHVSDPAVVPLSGPHGFSGEAWLHYLPLPHSVTDWQDRPRLLAPDERQLGMSLAAAIENRPVPPLRVADLGLPEPAADQLVVPALRPAEASWLEVSQSLRTRPVMGTVALPSWPRADILTNTVVRVAVEPDGTVLTAGLLQSCGIPQADAHALSFARAARFLPLPPADPLEPPSPTVFGVLTFHWHTAPGADPVSAVQGAP